MLSKMPPQIVRLLALTIGIVVTYLVARMVLTPDSFGQHGWYRGQALEEATLRDPLYVGKQGCGECHKEVLELLSLHEHRTLSCESCHGIGREHALDPDHQGVVKLSDTGCMRCHQVNPSRPAWLKQITLQDHFEGSCMECHLPHSPNEEAPLEEEETADDETEDKQ